MTKRFFLDTEFLEGFQKPWLGKSTHFIDLISIGLVNQSGQTYYAISRDCDLKRAWNSFDLVPSKPALPGIAEMKVYWVRDNVLEPIFWELVKQVQALEDTVFGDAFFAPEFTLGNLKSLVSRFGKSNKQIADDIRHFVYQEAVTTGDGMDGLDKDIAHWLTENRLEFLGYYSDYDWVLFCSLFGRMVDLPTGFPMYCTDLLQSMAEHGLNKDWRVQHCPDPKDEHNALVDAKWSLRLYQKIQDVLTERRRKSAQLRDALEQQVDKIANLKSELEQQQTCVQSKKSAGTSKRKT